MERINNNKLLDLMGKVAIVTGGAMGIGRGIGERLAEAGASVTIADLDMEAAKTAADELNQQGHKALAVTGDVAKEDDVERIVAETVKTFGEVDILVNNAGIYPSELVLQMPKEDFDKVIDVNLRSVYLCTKLVAKQMIARAKGGKIINITSIDALHPSSMGLAHYDASKHGVWGFTKNVALELAPHKIWVNAIAPGGIATPGVEKLQSKMKTPEGVDQKEMLKNFLSQIPMGRLGDPDDIGKVALFLASDMSTYLTGTQIVVDGGVLLS